MNVQFLIQELPVHALPDRLMVLKNLSLLRKEWEAAADGTSLIDVSASVGLLLFDITNQLGLTQLEQVEILGYRLFGEASIRSLTVAESDLPVEIKNRDCKELPNG